MSLEDDAGPRSQFTIAAGRPAMSAQWAADMLQVFAGKVVRIRLTFQDAVPLQART